MMFPKLERQLRVSFTETCFELYNYMHQFYDSVEMPGRVADLIVR